MEIKQYRIDPHCLVCLKPLRDNELEYGERQLRQQLAIKQETGKVVMRIKCNRCRANNGEKLIPELITKGA